VRAALLGRGVALTFGKKIVRQTGQKHALRLVIKLRRQRDVDCAFGKYRWRGNFARGRKGRGTG
jgi:hypothetical protein